jgi:peptidoglycan/xylan/chitin deacetylase (PgdA/CDA1 family)
LPDRSFDVHFQSFQEQRLSRRARLGEFIDKTGIGGLLRLASNPRHLIVLNYHRIGNYQEAIGDPGVYSATAAEFDQQLEFLKHEFEFVDPKRLQASLENIQNGKTRRASVMLTFDDGYKDNVENAVPLLRRHGLAAAFFVPSEFIGSRDIPWWDEISYCLKSATQTRFLLAYPRALEIDFEEQGFAIASRDVLRLYKDPAMLDSARFMSELRNACRGEMIPLSFEQMFFSSADMVAMHESGMTIGAHGHSHKLLARLSDEDELKEIRTATEMLHDVIGEPPLHFAYPVGSKTAFSDRTKNVLKSLGYEFGFSFYGGINATDKLDRFNILRVAVARQSTSHLRTQVRSAAVFGRFAP